MSELDEIMDAVDKGAGECEPCNKDMGLLVEEIRRLRAELKDAKASAGFRGQVSMNAQEERDEALRAVQYLRDELKAVRTACDAAREERDSARKMLGECYVLSGADTDGDGWEHNWPHAVEEVRQLRQNYNEYLAATVAVTPAELQRVAELLEKPPDPTSDLIEALKDTNGQY